MSKKLKREKINYLEYTFNIFEKYDTWQISFKNPKDGKIIKRSTKLVSNSSNLEIVKKEIIPSLVEFLSGKIEIQELDYSDPSLDDFAKNYFEVHKNRVREHTYLRNSQHYRNHIKPFFGNKKISLIRPLELERWQNNFVTKNYKASSILKFRSVLYSILEEAVKNEIIKTNPLTLVDIPAIKKDFKIDDEDIVYPFSQNEIQKMLENSTGYFKNFIMLMVSSGIRPGEIVALTWEDINFEKKQITVNKTITNGKIGLPKTASSVRKVDILPLAELALKEQMKISKKHKNIFINSKGNAFYTHSVFGKKFKIFLQELNIDYRPLYNLRHTFASHLISLGEDILWISKNLGHLDISITMKHYTKFIKEDDETRFSKISKIGANFGANYFTKEI